MKIFGFSLVTILLFLAFYVIGARHPGPANAILSKIGM